MIPREIRFTEPISQTKNDRLLERPHIFRGPSTQAWKEGRKEGRKEIPCAQKDRTIRHHGKCKIPILQQQNTKETTEHKPRLDTSSADVGVTVSVTATSYGIVRSAHRRAVLLLPFPHPSSTFESRVCC